MNSLYTLRCISICKIANACEFLAWNAHWINRTLSASRYWYPASSGCKLWLYEVCCWIKSMYTALLYVVHSEHKKTDNIIFLQICSAKQEKIGTSCIISTDWISQKSKDILLLYGRETKLFYFISGSSSNCVLIHVLAFVQLRLIQIKSELVLIFLPCRACR